MKSVALMMFLLMISLFLMVAPAVGQPKMLISNDFFDFGYVPMDSKVSHVFWIKSVGTDTLKVFDIKPGCGCTQAPIKKNELAAGDSTELEIIYSSSQRVGVSEKKPTLHVNAEPSEQYVNIKVTALREPDSAYPVIIKPYRVYVSRAGAVEVDEGKFTITNVSTEKLDVRVVSQPTEYFSLSIPKKIAPGETVNCKLKVKPEKLNGEFFKSFTIELSDAAKSRFSVPVIRRFIGAVTPPAPPAKHGAEGDD